MIRLIALLTLFMLTSALDCTPHPTPTPNPPAPMAVDAGDLSATCAGVCEHGTRLGCLWARPTPGGSTCLDVCFNATQGGPITWDLGCRVRAPTCAAERACQ